MFRIIQDNIIERIAKVKIRKDKFKITLQNTDSDVWTDTAKKEKVITLKDDGDNIHLHFIDSNLDLSFSYDSFYDLIQMMEVYKKLNHFHFNYKIEKTP